MSCVRASWVLLLVLPTAPAVRAADIETRDFNVLVDGKPTGEAHITIHKLEDGTTVVTSDTDVVVKLLVGSYKYAFRGREQWKDGRLQSLESTCNDGGTLYHVVAVAEGEQLRLKVNNQEKILRGEFWPTSYWAEPTARVDRDVPLLDADSGRLLAARVQLVGVEQRTIAGQNVGVTHYRLTGKHGVADLWYDGQNRLVRREWVEDNHRTIIELSRLRR